MSRTISGTYTMGVTLSSGDSPTTITGSAAISGTAAGVVGVYGSAGTAWVLINQGQVSETGPGSYGISFAGGGMITNAGGGAIYGGMDGIRVSGSLATVVNRGSVGGNSAAGGAAGIYLGAGGQVSNQSTGTVSGYFGIEAQNAAATVVNAGIISGNYTLGSSGVYLGAGGSVTNQSGGTISGHQYGIQISGASGTVDNLGRIQSNDEANGYQGKSGIYLADGGVVTNGASGGSASAAYILGYSGGVRFGSSGPGTLINYGTISGDPGSPAVLMATGIIINGPSGATGALIESGAQTDGVLISGAGTVVNNGSIVGQEYYGDQQVYFGISLGGSGSVASSISNLGTSSMITDYVAVYAAQNATVTNAGTMAAAMIHGGAADNAVIFGGGTNRLIVDPGAVFVGTVSGSGPVTLSPTGNTQVIGTAYGIGSTTLELASAAGAGTLSSLGSSFTNFASLVFDLGAQWTVVGNTAASGLGTLGIAGFTVGDTIDLTGFSAVSRTYSSGALILTNAGGSHSTLHMSGGTFATANFGIGTDGGTGTDISFTTCFAEGTRIATECGEVPVEALCEGDRVVTADAEAQPIVWIGQRWLDLTRHADPRAAQPIRICKCAIAEGVPHRDLLLSPDHAILFDGLLIPSRLLVNGRSIAQDTTLRAVRYFHVELKRHAVLMTEGLGCESYLDTGNRTFFENGPVPMALHPPFDAADEQRRREMESCAPFAADAARVEPIWRQLDARAGALGFPIVPADTTDDPALHISIGHRTIRPICRVDGCHSFVLPGDGENVRLISRAAAPCDTRPWVEDRRRLGVMVKRLIVRCDREVTEIALDDPRLVDGWWAVEHGGSGLWRWTNGNAVLPSSDGPLILEVHVGETGTYLWEDKTAA